MLVEVDGANHYGITNEDSFRDPSRPVLDQAIATETIGRWSGLFLRAHILDDPDAFDYAYAVGDSLDPKVTVSAVSDSSVKTPEPSAMIGSFAVVTLLATIRRKVRASAVR